MKKNTSSTPAISSHTKVVNMSYFKHDGSTQDICWELLLGLEVLCLLIEVIKSFKIFINHKCPFHGACGNSRGIKPELKSTYNL